MADIKGVDLISNALKRQFEKKNFISGNDAEDGELSLDTRIISSALRILESRVEFVKSVKHSSVVLGNLKGKYKVLLAPKKTLAVQSTKTASRDDVRKAKQCDAGCSSKQLSGTPALLDPSTPPVPPVSLFSEEKIKLGWQGNEPIGAGMINLGNTCYLNSTLQALFHVPSFCNWLKSETEHNGIGKCDQAFISGDMCLICAVATTLRITHSHSGSVMQPVLVYGRLKSICKHLSHGHQEDAHEFLRFLIEGMERCFLLRFKGKKLDNLTKETTPLHRIFGGYLRNEVACHSCGKVSTTFQLFQDLFLDIRHTNTLLESMQAFFSRERLEGDDRSDSYKCEKCMRKGNCTKRVYVQTPPKVLCLQLKRFTAMGKKIMKHISYPLKLDLSPYVYIRTKGQNGSIISPSPKLRRPIPYKLVSVVSHYGSGMTCGHYTAVGRSAKGSYYTFDDSLVRPVSLNNALGASAYILMYEMEQGWQIGMENQGAEKVNNGSLKPIHSLRESSGSRISQNSPSKSLSNLQVKSKSLPDLKSSLNSKIVEKLTATTTLAQRTIKPGVVKLSSTSSSQESNLVKPSSVSRMASASPLKSSQNTSSPLNGWLNKEPAVALTKPSVAVSPFVPESTAVPLSSNSLKSLPSNQSRPPLLQKQHSLPNQVRPSKCVDNSCQEVKSDGPQKEQVVKKPKPLEGTLCGSPVRQASPVTSKTIPPSSSHKESSKNSKSKNITKKNSSSVEDVQRSTPLPKKQITLPNLINKKANASSSEALSTPHPKMKTLKDWLEVRSRSSGLPKEAKEEVPSKISMPIPAVVSTVGGWKVTNHNSSIGAINRSDKCKTVVLKRKRENIEGESDIKKKKYDQVAAADLWRTLFKSKMPISHFKKKDSAVSSLKKKLKEKVIENGTPVADTISFDNEVVIQKS